MAESDQSNEDKTEAATQRHLDQAREQGQVPVSREVATFASLGLVAAVIIYRSPMLMQQLLPDLVALVSRTGDANIIQMSQLRTIPIATLLTILPLLAAAACAGSFAVLLQTNFLLSLSALQPKVSRVSPAAGLKRIFGLNGSVEAAKSLGKLGLLAMAMWLAIKDDYSAVMRSPWQDPHHLLLAVARPVARLFVAGVCVQAIVAAADLMWVRFRHGRDLRMSKQNIRDEMKDTEGNPHVKARLRRIQMVRARRRMIAQVPTATVVITNPTHYAVALLYDRANNPAPRIVAKGTDAVAGRIREVAQAALVPIVANPPLARALYQLELDTEIPAEHYRVVAEIIAYVWRLRFGQRAIS